MNHINEDIKPIAIIGAGIAGIQAALDLANSGVSVILIEKKPSIGGIMAALDKTFPTLDCSICIEAPIMSDVMNHPNVTIKTLTEVIDITGEVGNFNLTLKETTRFVSSECTRCQDCEPVCPQITENEFDHSIGYRKAIFTAFAQAEPGDYSVDIKTCLNDPPNYLPCSRCVDVCKPQAINFFQNKEKKYSIEATSIIIATGFELLNPEIIHEYGYMKHKDILTSMEFERIVNAAGPTEGQLMRPSNGEHPHKALFVLCVGSRDQRYCAYCSRVCCMYSIKEAYQAKDHGIDEVDVLYMDIRAYGKGFDEFYDRTVRDGVNFIRGRPARIDTDRDKPIVIFENTEDGEIYTKEYDIVVLAPAMLPSRGTSLLAEMVGLDLDNDGFIQTNTFQGMSVKTSKPGVYVAGCAEGPKDIPDSVVQAGAAAAAAMTHILQRYWPEIKYEETIETDGEERVGVFVCDCGSNIAGVIDVSDVVDYASKLEHVLHTEEVQFACAGSTTNRISEIVKEKGLNRLVIAACSPKTHTSTFQRAMQQAGLNKFMLSFANIRNQSSWVHKKEPEKATIKARDMVSMSVSDAIHQKPLKELILPVIQKAIVIGGGAAGLAAAWNLGKQGHETHLVEKSSLLGGILNDLKTLAPNGTDAKEVLNSLIKQVEDVGVNIHLNTTLEAISGAVGNYSASLSNGTVLEVGAIILSYGAKAYEPESFNYGNVSNVITNQDLENQIKNRDEKNITFLNCVGSRFDEKGCSRYCCTTTMHQALELKEQGKNVTILYKDIRTYTRNAEELYYTASRSGVAFVQYPQKANPEEAAKFDNGCVTIYDELLGSKVAIPTDLLVLVTGLTAPDDHSVADMLKLSKSTDNFLLELHPKLAPVEAAMKGIYMGGNVRGPVTFEEAVAQGLSAASKASELLAKDTTVKEPIMAKIDPDKCIGCTICVRACTFNAIKGVRREPHEVIEAACTGCGNCAGSCPYDAIVMPSFTNEQINSQIDSALAENPEDKVLVFTCNWCSYAGADQAGIAKTQYPTSSRIIRTMCSARINEKFIDRSFDLGAGAVLLTGCRLTEKGSDCHYNFANVQTEKRYNKWKKKLSKKGIDDDRLQLQWVSAAEGGVLAKKLYEMEKVLHKTNRNGRGDN
jgi:heterodisulfide reductase subunit A2